jgi:hypothetical protein
VTPKLALLIARLVNIAAVEMMKNVFHGSGNVMENQIVRTNRMSQVLVRLGIVALEPSNVQI